jgi:hypothetical protein
LDRAKAAQAEQIDIAKSAKDATWAAVNTAKQANTISITALIVAGISVLIAIFKD